MPRFLTTSQVLISANFALLILLSVFGRRDLLFPGWGPELDISAKLTIAGALVLCATSTWYLAYKVYRRRMRVQADEFNARLTGEISFRDTAIEQHCIVSVTDPDGRYVRVNQKFLSVFGYAEADVVGQPSDLIYFNTPEDCQDDWAHAGQDAYQTLATQVGQGQPWSGEQVLRKSDGSPVVVSATIIPQIDDHGRHICNVCLRTDITEQKLSETQRQLCLVLDDLQDEVFIYEVDSLAIRYMNKAALSRFGWSLAVAERKSIPETTPDFDVRLFRGHTAPLFAGQRQVVAIQGRHGGDDVEISTRIHRDGSGRRLFLSVLRDISGRKKIEKARMESMAQVSHELRTPLTSIRGALGLVLSGKVGDIPPTVAQMVDIANRNSEHLQMMVNDILDLERMNSGKLSLTARPEDMRDIVEDSCKLNSTLGQTRGIAIRVTKEATEMPVHCDRNRISQVITNLLSNAMKYSPDNSVIDLAVSRHGKSVRVSVTDYGPGIPDSEQGKLFQNFSRVASGDGQSRSGTGLGLAICKKIVCLHKGKINLASKVGIGTTVYFDIPRYVADRTTDVVPLFRTEVAHGKTAGTLQDDGAPAKEKEVAG